MTSAAQNAFLKLLEEPPRNVYMLLLCESTAGLLPTVLSRAPLIRMQIFSDEELDAYLTAYDKKAVELRSKNAEGYSFVLRSSGGCIGEAKKKLSPRSVSGDKELYDMTQRCIMLLSSSGKADFYLYLNNLVAKREEFSEFLESWNTRPA